MAVHCEDCEDCEHCLLSVAVQCAGVAGVEGRPMLVLDGVLCTRGCSSVASPAVSVSGA